MDTKKLEKLFPAVGNSDLDDFGRRAIRHGECVMIPVKNIPEGAETVFTGAEYIVAHSETGHHHVAKSNSPAGLTVATLPSVLPDAKPGDKDYYLRVQARTVIEHQKTFDKHQTLELLEGDYIIGGKTEYDYFAKMRARVAD